MSVNGGNNDSAKTKFREQFLWLVFIWCIAHPLELALIDVLSTTEFADVSEMLLRTYCLYKKAPKKLNKLWEIHEIYKQTVDFERGS